MHPCVSAVPVDLWRLFSPELSVTGPHCGPPKFISEEELVFHSDSPGNTHGEAGRDTLVTAFFPVEERR